MNKNILRIREIIVFGLLILTFFSSCVTQKNIPYFQDIPSGERTVLEQTAKYIEPTIQVDDILAISIQTLDPESSQKMSLGAATPVLGSSNGGGPLVNGFLVDKNGEVELMFIGKVKVAGLTTSQARDLISKLAVKDYVTPSVQVRFANFKVTVLGEVTRPASYTLPNEKVSILDAIGLAGDLTIYGMRDNIKIVRENNGQTEVGFINLNSKSAFNNPYFYLKQNDVIYVEPNKAKIATTDASRTRMITVGASIASALIVLLLRLL